MTARQLILGFAYLLIAGLVIGTFIDGLPPIGASVFFTVVIVGLFWWARKMRRV